MKKKTSPCLVICLIVVLIGLLFAGLCFLFDWQICPQSQSDDSTTVIVSTSLSSPTTEPSSRLNAKLGQIIRNIVYKRVALPLHLDLYMPHQAVYEPAPVVVFIHGGSFVAGDKTDVNAMTVGLTMEVLRQRGFAVASVEYRLLNGDNTFPVNVTDVRDAIRYLASHADDYVLDPTRIATWGSSAGSTLALAAAYLQDDLTPPDPALAEIGFSVFAVIDINGPTDLVRSLDPSRLNDAFSQFMQSEPHIFFGDKDPANLAALVSPNNMATRHSPPTLIMHGKKDYVVDVSESKNLAATLASLDVPHELFLLDKAGHGLVPADEATLNLINKASLDFLLKYMPTY